MIKKRSILLIAVLIVALVATTFAFVGCNKADKTNANLKKPGDVFALAGVSTGAMLGKMQGNAALAGEAVVEDEIVAELNEYMALVESLIAGNPEAHKVEPSKREGYEKVQVMNVPDMNGKFTEYRLYYNETAKEQAADEDEESDEQEYESHITGIMVIGENEFPIKGDIEVETEGDEAEQSIEFIAYLNEDKSDYIKFEQETESETEDGVAENETEYSYKIYENNKFISSFELEIEYEGEEEEYSIVTNDASGKVKFELEKEKKGDKTDVKVKYTKGGNRGEFKVESTTDENGNPVYKYILKDKEIELDKD